MVDLLLQWARRQRVRKQINPMAIPFHLMQEWQDLRGEHVTDEEVFRAVTSIPRHEHGLAFGVPGTTIATSSTPKTVIGAASPAQQATQTFGFMTGFDGTTSTNAPSIIEVCHCTFATNPAGTNSTVVTPKPLDDGRPETIQSVCGKNWTAEPTVVTSIFSFLIPAYMGSGIIFQPLTTPLTAKGGSGSSLRITSAGGTTPNWTGSLLQLE